MPNDSRNWFDQGGDAYARYRPDYPDALARELARVSPDPRRALDVGCGNRQFTCQLANHFEAVMGVDPSADQLAHAVPHARVQYRQAPAEQLGVAEHSISLITAAQAAHWFDLPRFYDEVRRVGFRVPHQRPSSALLHPLPSLHNALIPPPSLLMRPGGRVVGTDFCAEMLQSAPAKAEREGLPFPDATFEEASIAFGLRNVDEPVKCLREMARVVCPGRRVKTLENEVLTGGLLIREVWRVSLSQGGPPGLGVRSGPGTVAHPRAHEAPVAQQLRVPLGLEQAIDGCPLNLPRAANRVPRRGRDQT